MKDLLYKILADDLASELEPEPKAVELLPPFWKRRVMEGKLKRVRTAALARHRVLSKRYKWFLDSYNDFVNNRFSAKHSFYGGGVYASLSSKDRELANKWISPNVANVDYETAKMLSARAAEKVAQQFYKSMGHKVTDTAITQVTVMLQRFLPNETQIMRGLRNLEEEDGQTTENVEHRAQRSHRLVGTTWRGQHS